EVFLRKINEYTRLEAEEMAGANLPYHGSDLILRPIWTFLKLYGLKQGFRDGVEGLVFCAFSGVSAAVRAWKHRELTRRRLTIALGAGPEVPPRRDASLDSGPWPRERGPRASRARAGRMP